MSVDVEFEQFPNATAGSIYADLRTCSACGAVVTWWTVERHRDHHDVQRLMQSGERL